MPKQKPLKLTGKLNDLVSLAIKTPQPETPEKLWKEISRLKKLSKQKDMEIIRLIQKSAKIR